MLWTELLQALKGEPLNSGFSTDATWFLRPQIPTAGSYLLETVKEIMSFDFFLLFVYCDSKANAILSPLFAAQALITSWPSDLTTCLNTPSTTLTSTAIQTMMGPTLTTWSCSTRRGEPNLLRRLGRPRCRRSLHRDGHKLLTTNIILSVTIMRYS